MTITNILKGDKKHGNFTFEFLLIPVKVVSRIGFFKSFCICFEPSLCPVIFFWSVIIRNVQKIITVPFFILTLLSFIFKGKIAGGLFNEREYEKNDGSVGRATNLASFCKVDKIRSGDYRLPKDRLLSSNNSSRTNSDDFMSVPEVKNSELCRFYHVH